MRLYEKLYCKVAALCMIAAITAGPRPGWSKTNSVYVTNNCEATLGQSADNNLCNISEYNIGSKNGLLASVAGSPTAALPDSQPEGIAVTPNGKFAYVVGFNSNTITEYQRSASGALKAVPNGVVYTDGFGGLGGSGFSPSCPDEAVIDSSGAFLYVTDECNPFIYQYRINAQSGALTALPIPPFTNAAVSSTDGIAIDPKAGFVYATDSNNADVIEMSIDVTGSSCGAPGCLTFIATAGDLGGNFTNPAGIAVDPTGKFVYAVDPGAPLIASFAINGNGTLTALGDNVTNLQIPQNVVVEPSGKFVYVADQGFTNRGTSGGDIAIFQIDATTATCGAPGCVFAVTTVAPPNHGCPYDLVVDPTGQFLYGSEICFNNVLEYSINLAGCSGIAPSCLTPLGTGLIPAGVEPRTIVVGDPPRHRPR